MSDSRVRWAVLVLQLLTAAAMTGVIWVVQTVSYPQFVDVGEAEFVAYHARYMQQVRFVVMPLMLVELGSALVGVVAFRGAPEAKLLWVALVLLGILWITTGVVQVPQHRALQEGLDAGLINELVAWNWLRTAGWTLRALVLALVVWRVLLNARSAA